MSNRIKKFINSLGAQTGKYAELAKRYGRSPTWFLLDSVRCRLLHGADARQYISFQLFRCSHIERKTFVTNARSIRIEKKMNAPEERQLLDNKTTFNRAFSAFVHRDWLYAPDHTPEEVKRFVSEHPSLMVKDPNSNKGEKVFKVTAEQIDDLDAFSERMISEKLLMEEFITQHPSMAALNPTSVNTVRVVTVRDRVGTVRIVGASIRVGGAGQVVDNFHANGVQYPVDPALGMVIAGGVSFDGTRNIYVHPSTGQKVLGFCIPFWKAVVSAVMEAAAIPENLRYIGWDVAVTPEGVDFVEANVGQGSNGMQQDGVGKYPLIKKQF